MKVLCINDADKPSKIPDSDWIKKDVIYTVIQAIPMGLQPGKLGYKLKEVQLSQASFPYEYYDAARFIPIDGLVTHSKEEKKEFELDLV